MLQKGAISGPGYLPILFSFYNSRLDVQDSCYFMNSNLCSCFVRNNNTLRKSNVNKLINKLGIY